MLPLSDAIHAFIDWKLRADQATGQFLFPSSLPVFVGHFPGDPLLPGVYQIAAMLVLARAAWATPAMGLSAITRAKWLAPVAPDTPLSVCVTRQPGWVFSGVITTADRRCATCQFTCSEL